MLIVNRYCQIFTRICLILIYLSFYLVQLNIHFGATPDRSFFSGDFILQNSNTKTTSVLAKDRHKDSKSIGFRLNKRFHPKNPLSAPEMLQALVRQSFHIQTALLNDEQPLTSFSFNSPSLRGPPVVV